MQKFPIYKAIPSAITVSAFIFGFNAIKLGIAGHAKLAIFSIVIASILDLFDGRVARILGVNSKFGAELDSLSDLVCFGIATSFIILFSSDPTDKLMFYSVCFFSIAAMIRLARFNIVVDYSESYKMFFVGIPTPAGALLAIVPLCLEFSFPIEVNRTWYAIYLIIIGFLMVSAVPTFSSKGIKISKAFLPPILGICALFVIGIITQPWITLSIIGIIYIASIPISCFIFIKNKNAINK